MLSSERREEHAQTEPVRHRALPGAAGSPRADGRQVFVTVSGSDASQDRAVRREGALQRGDRLPAGPAPPGGLEVAQAVLRGGDAGAHRAAPAGTPPSFPHRWWLRSKRSPASARPASGCRCPGCTFPTSGPRRSAGASWPRSRRPPSGGGFRRTPSRPWAHRSWIFPRDPDFCAKAGRVLDLYAGHLGGKRLGKRDFVLSADEKTSIQARVRKHPSAPPAPGRAMRVEHEYGRGGALAYLAAWDVHRGKIHGRCEGTTGIVPFEPLVRQVMTAEPYASARRVFWVVDNGSSHRGQASAQRLRRAWPPLHLVHLPLHASWLNQIEIYFSIVQRKVLTPNDFNNLAAVARGLNEFEHRYNEIAEPFDWRFTRSDLTELV